MRARLTLTAALTALALWAVAPAVAAAAPGDLDPTFGAEGKSLVKMVGDSDENVSHLLMALYDIECA